MADNYFGHQELIKRTKVLATSTFRTSMRMFDRHVGMFYKKRIDNGLINYSPIQINRKGMADNWGIISCYHRADIYKNKLPIHFEIETKTGKGKLNPDQIIWRDFCNTFGIWWFENRDEKQLIQDMVNKAANSGLVISGVNFGAR